MTPTALNVLNIFLMALSAVVAWKWPFELFLFAYGVLGPLHYFTEISWLHDRRWFGSSGWDWIIPTTAAIGATAAYVAANRGFGLSPVSVEAFGETLRVSWPQVMTLVAVGYGLAAVSARRVGGKLACTVGVLAAGAALVQADSGRLLVSVFLVTLVHVLIFTSCFVLHGALRTKSLTGYVSWAVHLVIPATMLVVGWGAPSLVPVSHTDLQRSEPFHGVLLGMCRLFGVAEDRGHAVIAMRVVAYAYTYHYLNWFSKTEIIGWHVVSRKRLALIAGLWFASVVLYVADWQLAFIYLLALSVAHVYLEFPLNWRTLAGIGAELSALLPRKPAVTSRPSASTAARASSPFLPS